MEEAVVRGRLYELPSGIPVLEVPDLPAATLAAQAGADVLAYGTADPLADVATCLRAELPTAPTGQAGTGAY